MATLRHPGATVHYLTVMGIAELRQRLADLQRIRTIIIDEMRDLTSQSSAASALEDSGRALHQERTLELDAQINQIQSIIATAKVVERPTSNERVQIGSKVTVNIQGARHTYIIAGSLEADPLQGKISNESPLGRSLLGKRVNDHFEVSQPGKKGFDATILAIT